MSASQVDFGPATRANVPAIVALLADDRLGAARETTDLAPYLDAFDLMEQNPAQMLVVGNLDARVVATAQVAFLPGLSHQGALRCDLEAVRVAADLRNRGIGRDLCLWIIEMARDRGCRLVQLSSHSSRTEAHRFYERLGFEASHTGMKMALTT